MRFINNVGQTDKTNQAITTDKQVAAVIIGCVVH